ncbi:MAG: RNA polymerase sigma factor region1.1 domain-containing protein [Eubacterium sp.]
MRDQNEFMRQMLDLVEFAKTNENRITKEQVDDFCQDMKLQKSQLKLVYEFLEEHHIEVEGVTAKEAFRTKEGKDPSMNTEDSRYITVYRRELRIGILLKRDRCCMSGFWQVRQRFLTVW